MPLLPFIAFFFPLLIFDPVRYSKKCSTDYIEESCNSMCLHKKSETTEDLFTDYILLGSGYKKYYNIHSLGTTMDQISRKRLKKKIVLSYW